MSVAGLPRNPVATIALIVGGVVLVGVFLVVDRGCRASVLPPTAFRPGPLKWIYLTLGMMMAATMVDMYVPLFGQRLAGLVPVVAGFLGVALSIGWTVSEIISASVNRTRVIVRTVAVAPLVMAVGLTIGALTLADGASLWVVAVWAAGAGDHRSRNRHGVAAPVRLGDGLRRRSRRGWHRRRGDQHRPADLRGVRRRAGRRHRQHDRPRRRDRGAVAVRGVRRLWRRWAASASYRASRGQT